MRRLMVVCVATALMVAAGCSSTSESEGDGGAGSDETTTTTTPKTEAPSSSDNPPVEATTVATVSTTTAGGDAGLLEIVGTYDGEDCSYEGPETASIDDEFSLTLVNDSADAVHLLLRLIPPDRLTDIEPLIGSDTDPDKTSLKRTFYTESGPFAESSARAFLAAPGTYVVQCVSWEGATPIHVWWLAALEVNP